MDALLREIQASGALNSIPLNARGEPNVESMDSQAKEVWKLLDRLSRDDPTAYARFIEEQTKNYANESGGGGGGAPPSIMPTAGLCLRATVSSRRAREEGVLRPAALQRQDAPPEVAAGHTLFINLCTHASVTEPPRLPDVPGGGGGRRSALDVEKERGGAAFLDTQELLNLEIPLTVGDVRRIPRAQAAWAVDVITHEFMIRASQRDAVFKKHFAPFLAGTVGEEVGLNFNPDVGWERPAGAGAGGGTHYVGGTKSAAGGSAETPVPFPTSRLRDPRGGGGAGAADEASDVARRLGLTKGKDGGKKKGKDGAAAGAAAVEASPALASPSSLLRAIGSDAASAGGGGGKGARGSSGGSGSGGGGGGDGPVRELKGLKLTGGDLDAAAAAPPAAPAAGASQEAAAASEFASYVASLLPQQLLVHEGACRFGCDVGAAELVARVAFDPAAVDVASLHLADAELDVAADKITLRIPRALVRTYQGLAVALVPVLAQPLPVKVDPAGARAKFSRKAGMLTITVPVKAG